MFITSTYSMIRFRSVWSYFHAPAILPYILKTIPWITGVLQNVLSLDLDYYSAKFYQTYFYYKPSKYSPFTETHFCNLFTQLWKADK